MCCHESEIDADAKVIIYAGGVGEPGHSTDYVCAVKSLEHSCDIYFAKFGCDGVYDRDPNGKDGANAVFYPEVSFARIEAEGLKVIDLEAAQLLQKPASDGELCRGYIFALTAENISAMLCGKADDLRKTVLA
jgi:uridylate kinase